MKHGAAFRKFSRTSSHRDLMLRNLITSLFEHEQIKTTLPKAKDAARLAEKIITLGKRGDKPSFARASAFILNQNLLPKIFGTFVARYAQRPGGYTRIHKFGHRPGDNAPHAILELVDNPRDLRLDMTARSVGWELLHENLKTTQPLALIDNGVKGVGELIQREREGEKSQLTERTRWNLQKVLKYKDADAVKSFIQKTRDYIDTLLARPLLMRTIQNNISSEMMDNLERSRGSPMGGAGHRLPGETTSALPLAQRSLRRPKWGRGHAARETGSAVLSGRNLMQS